MLKPCIYRRFDNRFGYYILIPCSDNPKGMWCRLGFGQPHWNNADPAACGSAGLMAINDISFGYAHPGTITTWLTPTPFTTSGSFASVATMATLLGNASGHNCRYTTATGGYVEAVLPAGHNRFAFCHYVATNVTSTVRVALDGVVLENKQYGTVTYPTIDTLVYDVEPSASARTIRVTCVAGNTMTLYPISVRSWDTTTRADPRTASSGLHAGNDFMAYISQMRAAVSNGNLVHFPQISGGDWWRFNKPNTFEPILKHNGKGSQAWSALGNPHYTTSDDPLVAVVSPVLAVDSISIGNMCTMPDGGGIAAGKLYEADRIVITQSAQTTSGAANFYYTHCITADGISTQLTVEWIDSLTTIDTVYGTCISGAAGSATGSTGWPEIIHEFTVPNNNTRFRTNVGIQHVHALHGRLIIPDCPGDLEIASIGPGSYLMTTENLGVPIRKVYAEYDKEMLPAAASGALWNLGSFVRPLLKEVDEEIFV